MAASLLLPLHSDDDAKTTTRLSQLKELGSPPDGALPPTEGGSPTEGPDVLSMSGPRGDKGFPRDMSKTTGPLQTGLVSPSPTISRTTSRPIEVPGSITTYLCAPAGSAIGTVTIAWLSVLSVTNLTGWGGAAGHACVERRGMLYCHTWVAVVALPFAKDLTTGPSETRVDAVTSHVTVTLTTTSFGTTKEP